MPDVDALDHLDHRLGDVLRVIADPLDRFRDEHDLERRGDRARILHHVADELAHDREERGVDLLVAADDLGRRGCVEARECVERHLQHLVRALHRPDHVVATHVAQAVGAAGLRRLVRDLLRPRRRRARAR